MGQLVYEQHLGLASERRVEVELLQFSAPVLDEMSRKELEPKYEGGRVVAAVRLYDADDHLFSLVVHLARRGQHGKRLANPWRVPEIDAELGAVLPFVFSTDAA
jgi:hypothetical protein